MNRQLLKQTLSLLSISLLIALLLMTRSAVAQEPDTTPVPQDTNEPTVVGGHEAVPHAWPWQIAIFNGPYICGGTLLEASWVLTAAHCVPEETDPADLRIVLGAHNIYEVEPTQQHLGVSKIIVHEYFEPSNYDNDIALLHLATPATLNEFVQPVRLAKSGDFADEMALVAGWGTTATDGQGSDVLLQAELPVLSLDECRQWYEEEFGFSSWISDNMLCAGYEEGGVDSCQGDSGGPLLVADGEGGWLQVGIVSWGIGCASAKRPGVYTRVTNYAAWIGAQIKAGKGSGATHEVYLPLVVHH